jgi:ABC-2 type transport system permease protein
MNVYAVQAIYRFEMARWFRTIGQSLFSPVLSTSLYFVVFGAAIGGRMGELGGVPYGAFIVPGLVILTILMESVSNASFGIYMPRWAGTIYELLSAPVSPIEAVLGYVGAAATKSVVIGLVIVATAWALQVPFTIQYPALALLFLILITVSFCLFGFILGLLADGFERLQIVPMLILTPLTFLGGTFYSVEMLDEPWRTLTYFNPIVYLVSGFRWAFYGDEAADVNIWISVGATTAFLLICLSIVYWIFKTGYRLKN